MSGSLFLPSPPPKQNTLRQLRTPRRKACRENRSFTPSRRLRQPRSSTSCRILLPCEGIATTGTNLRFRGELRYARRNAKQTTLGKSARRAYHNPCHLCHNGKACCAINHRDRNLKDRFAVRSRVGATKIGSKLPDLIAVGLRAARLCKQR